MSVYQYKLGKNKVLSYSSSGEFQCPVVAEQIRESLANGKQFFPDEMKHSRSVWIGQNHIEYSHDETQILPNGDIKYTSYRIVKKATADRKDLQCRCSAYMVFLGYKVWVDKVINEGKIITIKGLGSMRHNREERRISTRYFKKKSAQSAYVRKAVAK